ncbi:MAG: 50S ribosomal protein L6 [Gammaproteobacteria bacterium]|nr:50S ribosomal protein L6 [Gammaproteobacteria bacterium]
MSRIARQPIPLPKGVEATVAGNAVTIKSAKGSLTIAVHPQVEVRNENGVLHVAVQAAHPEADAAAGTTRALLNNAVRGVTQGFQKKLELVGVGYRAQTQGKTLNLTLGFSHPVNYKVPDGISIETPSQTEIIIKGSDRQKVGQVAADIRGFRPPEPYKGKGVRYSDERVVIKEAKKK